MEQILTLKENESSIKSPVELFKNIQKIDIDYNQENVISIYLRTDNTIIDSEVIFKGGLRECVLDPKTLYRKALINNSNCVIIAHNHPSGSLRPSDEDKKVFKALVKSGEIVGIKLLDSIIFNKEEFYSLLGG